MPRAKHDYAALRLEYIQSDITIRALAKRHGISSWSTINDRKHRDHWDADREEYRSKQRQGEIKTLVDDRIQTTIAIHAELLYAIRIAIRRYIDQLQATKDPDSVSTRDLMGLIDKFLLLSGQPTSRSESKNLDLHDFGGILRDAPAELLVELAQLSVASGAGGQPVGRGPLIVLEGTRTA